MSLLSEAMAVPSRVQGLVRLLISQPKGAMPKKEVMDLLSPPALYTKLEAGGNMASAVLSEATNLGIVTELDGGVLSLTESFSERVTALESTNQVLPEVVLDYALNSATPDEELALTVAWFLEQDVLKAPGTWDEWSIALSKQNIANLLRINDVKYGNFAYWAPYLGLAQVLDTPEHGKRILPDPTECLRRILSNCLGKQGVFVPLSEALQAVAKRCPVLEGGHFRERLRIQLGERQGGWQELSSSTAHALLRLEGEGLLVLRDKADAATTQLKVGGESRRVAEVALR